MKSESIIVKCTDCGNDTPVSLSYYRSKPDGYPWRCKTCQGIYHKDWYKRKSKDEQERLHNQMSESAKRKFANQTDEEKQKISKNLSCALKKHWANLSEEEYNKKCQIAKSSWDAMSDESRQLQKQHVSESQRIAWSKLSDEEYMRRCHLLAVAGKKQWENKTPEEMDKIREDISQRFKKWWDTRTPEELIELSRKRAEGIYKRHQFDELNPNKNESVVLNYFNMYHIPWERLISNETIHPQFFDLFPGNPVTGAARVEPFHVWDIMVPTPDGGRIYIDVDGSVHNPKMTQGLIYSKYTGKSFVMADAIAFNDSKRPYQTDGYPAYYIKCWDDKVTLDSTVVNIVTNESFQLKQLLVLLQTYFEPQKEK